MSWLTPAHALPFFENNQKQPRVLALSNSRPSRGPTRTTRGTVRDHLTSVSASSVWAVKERFLPRSRTRGLKNHYPHVTKKSPLAPHVRAKVARTKICLLKKKIPTLHVSQWRGKKYAPNRVYQSIASENHKAHDSGDVSTNLEIFSTLPTAQPANQTTGIKIDYYCRRYIKRTPNILKFRYT